jgi:hypothetical protein
LALIASQSLLNAQLWQQRYRSHKLYCQECAAAEKYWQRFNSHFKEVPFVDFVPQNSEIVTIFLIETQGLPQQNS